MSQLNEGEGIETCFRYHIAKWHDSCGLKFNKSKLQQAEKRKAISQESTIANVGKKFTRRSKQQLPIYEPHCFFCDKKAEAGECLRKAATLELDFRVRKCAQQLQDEPLLAKLSAGDMVALDAEYHNKCLVSLYNRVRCNKSSTEPCRRCMKSTMALHLLS